MKKRHLCAAAMMMVCVSVPAWTYAFGKVTKESQKDASGEKKQIEYKTMHFVVTYDSEVAKDFVTRLGEKAEECYRSITQDLNFFRDEPWTFENRATVIVYADKETYMKKTNMPAWSAGAANPYQKEVYTYNGSWDLFSYTLVHELTHLIYKEYAGGRTDIPLWLDEAAAVYMEQKAHRSALEGQVRQMVKGDYIPLAKVMATTPADISGTTPTQGSLGGDAYVNAFYLESFSVLHYLIQQYGTFKFSMLNRAMRGGTSFEQAFFDTYRSVKDWNDLEKKWLEFYR
jgi:hypothetical protein